MVAPSLTYKLGLYEVIPRRSYGAKFMKLETDRFWPIFPHFPLLNNGRLVVTKTMYVTDFCDNNSMEMLFHLFVKLKDNGDTRGVPKYNIF